MEKCPETSCLTVPNNLSYLPAIIAYTEGMASLTGFKKSEIQLILLALEEAVANVVEHAFEADEKASYQLIFEPLSSGLKIIVKDKGIPFAPHSVPEYMMPTDMGDVVAGLGSFLMKKCVDEIVFHNLGRDGKELHLIKYLSEKKITAYHDASDLTLFSNPSEEKTIVAEKMAYTVRLMEPSESLEVSRLFYRAYGYSYGIDSIYYPDRFERLHRNGSIISVVTVTAENKIVGHFALVKETPESRIAEAAMAVVQPEFRGQGCQNEMMARLLREGCSAGLIGVFSKAVTNHIYAQKAGEKAGFRRTAIVVGLIPADRAFKGIQSELSQRESVAYGYFTLSNPQGITIYPPLHHYAFIQKIYRSIGLDRSFIEPTDEAVHSNAEGISVITTTMFPTYNRAVIEVGHYGENAISDVRAVLRDICNKKIDQIMLYLNLGDPCTAEFCEKFEKLGFFFAGILPFSHVGEALILQYLNNVPMDYSKIKVASESGQEILNYLQEHDPNYA